MNDVINEAIYMVRKQGIVQVGTKAEALSLVAAAAKEGYNFGQKKQGWSFLVIDLDA